MVHDGGLLEVARFEARLKNLPSLQGEPKQGQWPGVSRRRRLLSSAVGVSLVNILSLTGSAAGLLVLTRRDGLSAEMDAFWVTLPVATLVGQVPSALAWALLIPAIAGLVDQGKQREAWSILLAFTAVLLAMVCVIAAVLYVAAPGAAVFLAPGLTGFANAYAVSILRSLLPYGVLTAAGGALIAALNAHKVFLLPALCSSFAAWGGVVVMLARAESAGPMDYILGLDIGATAAVLILLGLMARVRPPDAVTPDWRHPLLLAAGRRALGVAIVRTVDYLPNFLLRAAASHLSVGSVSAIGVASTLLQPPVLIASAVTTVIFPTWAAGWAEDSQQRILESAAHVNRVVLWMLAVLSVSALALSPWLASIVTTESDRTHGADVRLVALCFGAVIVSWPWVGTNFLIGSLFWANSLIRQRVFLELAFLALMILLLSVLSVGGPAGLLTAQSLSFLILLLGGWRTLTGAARQRLPSVGGFTLTVSALLVVCGGALFIAALTMIDRADPLLRLLGSVGLAVLGVIAFVVCSVALRMNEPREIWRVLRLRMSQP